MISHKTWKFAAFALFTTAFPFAAAAVEYTNEMAIQYLGGQVTIIHPEPSEQLFTRFFQEITTSDSIVFDRFSGPGPQLGWERKHNLYGYDAIERFNQNGAKMFATIGLDSLRTAAAASLPLDSWQDSWERGFVGFLTGTVGNPEEEHVQMRSISYSAVRSSWERSAGSARFQWGLRPWNTTPYLYFLTRAGRMEGNPLVTLETRASYTLFGYPQLEGRLSLQLPFSFRIAGGGALNLARMGMGDPESTHCSITLERALGKRGDAKGVFFIGFRSGANHSTSETRSENRIIAGISRPW